MPRPATKASLGAHLALVKPLAAARVVIATGAVCRSAKQPLPDGASAPGRVPPQYPSPTGSETASSAPPRAVSAVPAPADAPHESPRTAWPGLAAAASAPGAGVIRVDPSAFPGSKASVSPRS